MDEINFRILVAGKRGAYNQTKSLLIFVNVHKPTIGIVKQHEWKVSV